MKIRYTKLKDAYALSKLIKLIISTTPYYSAEAKREEIRKHNYKALKQCLSDKKYYICIIAVEKKQFTGFVIGRNEAGVFWVDWIGVRKEYRRKGVSEELMKELENSLLNKGIHKIWCDTRISNKESNALLSKLKYKKLGFFRNGWYKQDFFLWEKDIA